MYNKLAEFIVSWHSNNKGQMKLNHMNYEVHFSRYLDHFFNLVNYTYD